MESDHSSATTNEGLKRSLLLLSFKDFVVRVVENYGAILLQFGGCEYRRILTHFDRETIILAEFLKGCRACGDVVMDKQTFCNLVFGVNQNCPGFRRG